MADGPLIGFRILDLTAVISGPFCTQLLGDLGADVIKIEPPEGDSMRRNVGPQRGGLTAAFLNFNRNKRSIVIDIKKEHGRDLVRRLAVKADALVENNRPGVAERLGIGYADIRRANPKVVYCSICGFPPKGRLANFPAYDPVIQGYSGMAYVQGLKAGQPTAVKMALADKVSGMTAALAVVSALHAARARGVGQYIKVPMLEAMMAFTANDSIYGLAASVWTRDLTVAHKTVRDLEAGVIWVNCFDHGDMTQPFGGYKQSGQGRDKCVESLISYTQTKSAWINLGD